MINLTNQVFRYDTIEKLCAINNGDYSGRTLRFLKISQACSSGENLLIQEDHFKIVHGFENLPQCHKKSFIVCVASL